MLSACRAQQAQAPAIGAPDNKPSAPVTLDGTNLLVRGIRYEMVSGGAGLERMGVDISADGRYVAFASEDPTLTPGETNDTLNVFVRDRQTGAVERISGWHRLEKGTGVEDVRWCAQAPVMTPDARFVAYISGTPDPYDDDPDSSLDRVFLRDRVSGTTKYVSAGVTAPRGRDCIFWRLSVSADGRYVAFACTRQDIRYYVCDTVTGLTRELKAPPVGNRVADIDQVPLGGQFLVVNVYRPGYDPQADSAPGDLLATWLVDTQDGTVDTLTATIDGRLPLDDDGYPNARYVSISDDARFVAFSSSARNLVENDTNGVSDCFVFDRVTKTTRRVSVTSTGAQVESTADTESVSPGCFAPAISGDGSHVLFEADNTVALVPGGSRIGSLPTYDLYVRDLGSGRTTRVTDMSDASDAIGRSNEPYASEIDGYDISGDGKHVVLESDVAMLLGLTNPYLYSDAFVWDLAQ